MSAPVRVLVVDDDALMRGVLRRMLGRAGMCVHTYTSGRELLASADLSTPAVLLLDVNMPSMSGLQLQLLLRDRGNALPIVFLTGVANVAMAVSAMRDGAVNFMEKPFDAASLVACIHNAYSRHVESFASTDSVIIRAHRLRLASLTPRERIVLDLMVTGRSSKAMARELGGSYRTIEIHRGRVMTKMAVTSLADLVRLNIAIDDRRL